MIKLVQYCAAIGYKDKSFNLTWATWGNKRPKLSQSGVKMANISGYVEFRSYRFLIDAENEHTHLQ